MRPIQWRVIWIVAVVVVLSWPAANGSLAVKGLRWAADPGQTLPPFPEPLPRGLEDNGDAVAEHDALEQEFYRVYQGSSVARFRYRLKELEDPLDPTTARQVLGGLAVLATLLVWRLDRKNIRP